MEVEQSVPEVEPNEPSDPVEPNEAVVIKKRGRPKGSLNRKTIEKMRQDVLPEIAPEELPPVLDVDFTSDEVLGEKPRATPKRKPRVLPEIAPEELPPMVLDVDFTSEEILGEIPPAPKRKAKARPKPAPPSSSESEEEPPPPPPKLKRERTTNRKPRVEPEPLNPPSYLEVLTRGLREQKAKQHAEKIAEYDKFFQW